MSPTGLSLQRNTSNGGWRFYEKTDEKGAPIIGGELDLARVLAAVVGAGSGILVGVVSQHKSNTDTIPIVNK
jgi:hypothetical protein